MPAQPPSAVKYRIRPLPCFLAGTALALAFLAPMPLAAQEGGTEPPLSQDTLAAEEIEFEADELAYDRETGEVQASGNVIIRREGYRLQADRVAYDEDTGIVRAEGHVEITDPGGNVLLLDEAELDDELREGFVRNVRFIFSDGSRLAAQSGERRIGRTTIFNYAAYSPCQIICERGQTKEPQWQIKAVRVTHDQEERRLYYKDAYLELFGLPVLYTPYLSHPDPTVERASGFLVPEIGQREQLGLTLATPYYWVINEHSDATITPIFTTEEGIVLGGEYRRHVGIGQIEFDGSLTYVDERNDLNQKTGDQEFRGHLFSDGELSHGQRWRSTYQLQVASDDTYLRRYGFSRLDTLTSQYLAEGFYGPSYVSVQGLGFQGLRQEDVQGLTPFALPMVDVDWRTRPDHIGGSWQARMNALALHRPDGLDTRRIASQMSYTMPFTNRLGQVVRLGAHIRGDIYNVDDAERPDLPVFGGENGTEGRFLPYAEASIRWPFIKAGQSSQQIVEPILSLVVARRDTNPEAIPNEDSRVFELTDTNIFSANRFVGFDRFEGGTRLNYGGRYAVDFRQLSTEILVGQSYRFSESQQIFPTGAGLEDNFSDFVGHLDISWRDNIDLAYRFRLDKKNLRIRRNEIDTSFGTEAVRFTLGYFQLNRNRQIEGLEDREEIRAGARFRINKEWSLYGNTTQDLTGGADPVAHNIGLLYTDECLEFSLTWQRTFTQDRDIRPGTSVQFRIRLKNLG